VKTGIKLILFDDVIVFRLMEYMNQSISRLSLLLLCLLLLGARVSALVAADDFDFEFHQNTREYERSAQADYDRGFEDGKKAEIFNYTQASPLLGLNPYTNSFNHDYERGFADGKKAVKADPSSNFSRGFEDGKKAVKADPYSYQLYDLNATIPEIVNILYSDLNSTYYNKGYDLGYSEGNQSVYSNPGEYNLLTLEEFDESVIDILKSKTISSMPYTSGWFFVPDRGWLFANQSSFPWFYEPQNNNFMMWDQLEGNASFYHPKARMWVSVDKKEFIFPIKHIVFGRQIMDLESFNMSLEEHLQASGLPLSMISSIINSASEEATKRNSYTMYELLSPPFKIADYVYNPGTLQATSTIKSQSANSVIDETSGGLAIASSQLEKIGKGSLAIASSGVQIGKKAGENEITTNPYKHGLGKLSDVQDLIDKELEIKYANSVKSGKMKGFSDAVESVLKNDYSLVNKDFLSDFNTTQEIKDSPYTNGWFYQTEVGWRWTDKTTYPYIYDQNTGGWLYFISDSENALLFEYDSKSWKNVE